MALTFVVLKRGISGNGRFVDATVNFDSSYDQAGGGEATALSDWVTLLGHGYGSTATLNAAAVQAIVTERDGSGNQISLDRTNGRFRLFAAGAEAGNGTNQSAVTCRFRAFYDNNTG